MTDRFQAGLGARTRDTAPARATSLRTQLHLVARRVEDLPSLRHELDAWLAERAPEGARQAMVLLASELVTNACVHGIPPASVDAHLTATTGTLIVADRSPELPQASDVMPFGAAEGGRGLLICKELSESLMVRRLARGKAVVATVAL